MISTKLILSFLHFVSDILEADYIISKIIISNKIVLRENKFFEFYYFLRVNTNKKLYIVFIIKIYMKKQQRQIKNIGLVAIVMGLIIGVSPFQK